MLAKRAAGTLAYSPAGTKGDGEGRSPSLAHRDRAHLYFHSLAMELAHLYFHSLATELSYGTAANPWLPRPQEPLQNKSPNHLKVFKPTHSKDGRSL